LALETAAGIAGDTVETSQVLGIGDGVKTDIAGARGFGLDAIFVASRLHAPGEGDESLDATHLAALFGDEKRRPIAAMRALDW